MLPIDRGVAKSSMALKLILCSADKVGSSIICYFKAQGTNLSPYLLLSFTGRIIDKFEALLSTSSGNDINRKKCE